MSRIAPLHLPVAALPPLAIGWQAMQSLSPGHIGAHHDTRGPHTRGQFMIADHRLLPLESCHDQLVDKSDHLQPRPGKAIEFNSQQDAFQISPDFPPRLYSEWRCGSGKSGDSQVVGLAPPLPRSQSPATGLE